MKKPLIFIVLLLIMYQVSSVTSTYAQPRSCSADKDYEDIPRCVTCYVCKEDDTCADTLFCQGNNYRLCETDPRIPDPAPGERNESWWYDAGDFPDGTILYNGVSFPVPEGGVRVCDANVYGCANRSCKGGDEDGEEPIVPAGPVELDTSPSLVCGETTYKASKEITPVPTPEEEEGEASVLGLFNLFGEVRLPKAEFPDYSLFETVVRRALTALLPAYWHDSDNPGSLNIPQGSLPIKIKHRIEGQNPKDRQDPNKTVTNSETDATFVPFLAENYALSAVLNPKSGLTNSLNYVLPEVEPGIPPEGNECVEGGETKDEDLTLNNPNPGFSANILEEIINIIGSIIKKFWKTEVKVESRGHVYGGEKLIEKSEAASTFVPKYFLPGKNASSYQEGVYRVSTNVFGAEEKTETLKYQGQKAVHDRYCNLLCAVYPAKFKPKDCECQ